MMMSDLPGDLLEEILCRVPAASLKQSRSTCRGWNSLFNNRRFARKHFHKAAKQHLILLWTKKLRVCSTSVDLHGVPSMKVISEIILNNSASNSAKIYIEQVFHCQGLLLCAISGDTILVSNPCTGQTVWIQPPSGYKTGYTYSLGSYQANKSHDNYKILGIRNNDDYEQEFTVYEINNSNSWRILDVSPDFTLLNTSSIRVSLKGKTYWFAWDEKEEQLGICIVSFDYTKERFERLRFQSPMDYDAVALSSVREEKLSVLLQRRNTREKEIWVTNKIYETKVVSWTKVLTLDSPANHSLIPFTCFVFDEEKKIAVMQCEKLHLNADTKSLLYIAGEDNKITQVDFGVGPCWPFFLNYVPSLVQIE